MLLLKRWPSGQVLSSASLVLASRGQGCEEKANAWGGKDGKRGAAERRDFFALGGPGSSRPEWMPHRWARCSYSGGESIRTAPFGLADRPVRPGPFLHIRIWTSQNMHTSHAISRTGRGFCVDMEAERDVAEVGLYEDARARWYPGRARGSSRRENKEKKDASAMDPGSSVPRDTPFLAFDRRRDHGRHVHLPSVGSAHRSGFQYWIGLRDVGAEHSRVRGAEGVSSQKGRRAGGGTRRTCSARLPSAQVSWGPM